MTIQCQVLLELIRYASDRGKPAVLSVQTEWIEELTARGLVELRENGYWITEIGRSQQPQRTSLGQLTVQYDVSHSSNVPAPGSTWWDALPTRD